MLSKLLGCESQIGYQFKDKNLLIKAFTHASYTNENASAKDNERLEFLGDSVLGLVVAERLFLTVKEGDEGCLTRLKQRLVSKKPLSKSIIDAGLDKLIIMGKGEQKQFEGGRVSITENLFEAIVGAIYLDGGITPAKEFIFKMLDFDRVLSQTDDLSNNNSDHKTSLQHFVQKNKLGEIQYKEISVSGPPHNPTFTMAVIINDKVIATEQGQSHKKAEQRAAFKALQILTNKE